MKLHQYTSFIDTNIYLAAASELEYEIEVIDFDSSFAKISNEKNNLYIYENWLSLNDQVSFAFARNKRLANKLLRVEMPDLFPESLLIDTSDSSCFETAVMFTKKHKYRIVIKPNSASLGIGVTVLPKNDDEVIQVINNLKETYKHVVLETYIAGKKEYRIVYVQGNYYDAVQRIPAYVIGNGTATINSLISEKNSVRAAHDFPQIIIDESLEMLLSQSELSLESVLPNNQKVTLKSVCSFAQGGETKRVDLKEIHPDFLVAFSRIAQISRLNFLGIDLMCDDISHKPASQSVGVNEINSGPMADLHYYADMMQNQPLASTKRLLQQLLV